MNTNINFLLEEVKRKRLIISRFFIWFPISGLGEPNIYHDSGVFYKNVGIWLGGLSDCEELSGGYSQEMMWMIHKKALKP